MERIKRRRLFGWKSDKKSRRTRALSQKINIAFAIFFLLAVVQTFVDHTLADIFSDPASFVDLAMVVIAVLFLFLSRYDNLAIRFIQIGSLMILSLVLVVTSDDGSDLVPYVLLSVSLAAAYKMKLFGITGTLRFLGIVIALTIGLIFVGGVANHFTLAQMLNIVNFVVVYFLLLYFIFEEETIELYKRHEILTSRAEDMKPFAELGEHIAGLIHDFKGDISGIYALAEIERLSGNTDTSKKLLRYGERLEERTQAVMYVATGRERYDEETIDLSEMLRSVVYYFIEIHRDLKHKIEIELDVLDAMTFVSRRSLILVILENVLKNSVEATEGQMRRYIRVSADKEDGCLIILIENSGPPLPWDTGGKPVDVRKKQLFRRGVSTKDGGTGFGMMNVVRALEILGADMTMENSSLGVLNRISFPCSKSPDLTAS